MTVDTVLLAVGRDDESRVRRLADLTGELAEATGADVVLGHAFASGEVVNDVLDQLEGADGTPTDVARRLEPVRAATRALRDAGVAVDVRGVVGDPGEAVTDLAADVEADRVVVGGRRRSPTGKAVFGSTAQRVLLSAPCPVTFVRE